MNSVYECLSSLDRNGYPNLILEEHKIKLDNSQCKLFFKHRISQNYIVNFSKLTIMFMYVLK